MGFVIVMGFGPLLNKPYTGKKKRMLSFCSYKEKGLTVGKISILSNANKFDKQMFKGLKTWNFLTH